MKLSSKFSPTKFLFTAMIISLAASASVKADLIELTNGDHYRGTVLGMTLTNIDFLSEIQGRVKLPRDKVAEITLHDVAPRHASTNLVQPPVPAPTDSTAAPIPGASGSTASPTAVAVSSSAVIQQLRSQGVDPKMINQIQEQIFGKSSPEAAQKFNDMVNGLTSGKISLKDIQAQAQDSINQIRAAKKDLGPDTDDMLDGYLGILEKFVQESKSDTSSPITATAPATKSSVK